jgi:hypothetical protein
MDTPRRRLSLTRAASRPQAGGGSPELAALLRARRVRRRELVLVEQYLAQIRTVASAQARMGARRTDGRP